MPDLIGFTTLEKDRVQEVLDRGEIDFIRVQWQDKHNWDRIDIYFSQHDDGYEHLFIEFREEHKVEIAAWRDEGY